MEDEARPQHCYSVPDWLSVDTVVPEIDEQVRFAITLSRRNIEQGGGPFGAAVFDAQGRCLSAGVNVVMTARSSLLHAEVVAIQAAQERAGTWDLGALPGLRLVASCQPCVMCFGAVLWSGVSELVYAATADDARAIGFDEGPLVPDWADQLRARGVHVIAAGPELRAEAVAVLQAYAASGQAVYNPTRRPSEKNIEPI